MHWQTKEGDFEREDAESIQIQIYSLICAHQAAAGLCSCATDAVLPAS